jgi:hypothetical protein
MAHFLVVVRPDDGHQGSVTAFNMNDVHRLFMVAGETDLSVTVRDVMEPAEEPDYILAEQFVVCQESEVLLEMKSKLLDLEWQYKCRKEAKDGQALSE